MIHKKSVSGQKYIGDTGVKLENQMSIAPVIIELTKPIILMTRSEKNEFINEILKALEGKWK